MRVRKGGKYTGIKIENKIILGVSDSKLTDDGHGP